MQVSHSRIETFTKCPRKYFLRYIQHLETFPNLDPDNALFLGSALHTGIQVGVQEALDEFRSHYFITSDEVETEVIKLETQIRKARQVCPPDGSAEVVIKDPDYIGFIDWLVPARSEQKLHGEHQIIPNQFDLYDFKYSNNERNYLESDQLHLYKYYFEKTHQGQFIRNMYFLMVPKSKIKRGKNETLEEFRKRVVSDLGEPYLKKVEYDPSKVIRFLTETKHCIECTDYEAQPSYLCRWCEYEKLCQKGNDVEMLPSTNRVETTMNQHKKIWIYGEPFSGKTFLADKAPDPVLELNTDGNVRQFTMPRIPIVDSVSSDRMHKRTYAWEVFKEAVDDLEKGSDFQTIVVDLLEDVYDSCRKFVCDQRGWEHESDDSFKAYDIVRSEFLRTLKRLLNLPYNIILISHVDMSKDITKKSGDKVTAIKPNINDKLANKIAGMVDIVIRTIKDDDNYTISTKTSNVVFGGGRLSGMKAENLPNSWGSIEQMYGCHADPAPVVYQYPTPAPVADTVVEEPVAPAVIESAAEPAPVMGAEEAKPVRRSRRVRN